MGYRVVVAFKDLKDNSRPYKVGEVYPRKGFAVSEERLAELSSTKNRRGIVIIAKDEPKEEPKAIKVVEEPVKEQQEKPVVEKKPARKRKATTSKK